MTLSPRDTKAVTFDGSALNCADIEALAKRRAHALLGGREFAARIDRGAAFLEKVLRDEGVIYGVTTGYGDSCQVSVPADQIDDLSSHLHTFHGCGLGEPFSIEQTRAILAARLASLCQGYSGVRFALLEHLALLIERDILPVMPSEGSVGASGDLTPLSYLAAVIEGEREVWFEGERRAGGEVYQQLGIKPLKLRPKEGLAIMNGTAAMTGLACLAIRRAEYLEQLASRITSLCSLALQGNDFHFDPVLFSVKPHRGQQDVAAWIHTDLRVGEVPRNSSRVQDRYSLRCAPHVIGVLRDALAFLRPMVENELNSANDNPIIDAEGEHILHGGHFYGGHIAFAMDSLKNAVANVAELLDRQVAQLVDTKFNHGLPPNLAGSAEVLSHGFKAVQIGCSAWTAEALKNTMPASVFSRSTECHNQDKVSMGTIAARDCKRVLTLAEQVAAAAMLAAWQGVQLRRRSGELADDAIAAPLLECMTRTAQIFKFVERDRPLQGDLERAVNAIAGRYWVLYESQ